MRKALLPVVVLAAGLLLGACGTSYEEREKFLDKMTVAGVAYRQDLLKQGTPVSEGACAIGWDLLNVDIPADGDGAYGNETWNAQPREAYIKGCMTGQPRPKPEPSGVHAVTAVPNSPASPSPEHS